MLELLEMAVNGWKGMHMAGRAGIVWHWLKKGWTVLEMSRNSKKGWKLLKRGGIARMAGMAEDV